MAIEIIRTQSYPTRYVAFDNPGKWVFLDIDWSSANYRKDLSYDEQRRGELNTDARWLEMAVYDQPNTKDHAVVRRHPTPLKGGREYVADVCRDGRGDSLLAFDFVEAVKLAEEWLGL